MAKNSICKSFLRNWILWTLVLVGILGIILAIVFALQPCEEEFIYTMADIDLMLVIDVSGSVNDDEYVEQMNGTRAFLEGLWGMYTGDAFRTGMIQFGSSSLIVYALPEYTVEEMIELVPTTPRAFYGGTNTHLALDMAREHMEVYSNASQFRIVIVVSDGASNQQALTMEASANIKKENTTVVGIMIGQNDVSTRELYSVTSCTSDDNTAVVPEGGMHSNCTYFANARDFDQIEQNAANLAASIEVPMTEDSICVYPEYFLYLLLLLPLLAYLFLAPLAHYLRMACCPPAPMSAGAVLLTGAGGGGAASGMTQGADGKWKSVNAGGYLWSMSGRGTGIVEVNFGDKAPPSAPGAVVKNPTSRAAREVQIIYGGGETQLWLSRYLCCCFWCCLSAEDKAELDGGAPQGYTSLNA